MGRMSWKTRTAAILSAAAAAALVGTAPAYAYKLDDKQVELNGLGFVNFIAVDGNAADTSKGLTESEVDNAASGAHFERAYFEMRYHPESSTTYRITLDSKGNDSSQSVFVKYVYADIKIAGENSPHLKFGLNHTPVVDYYQTHIWGHRYVAKTFTDELGAYTSSDLGVSLYGDLGEMVDYYVSLMNGEGYTKGSDGSGFALAGRVEVKAGRAKVGVHGHTETDRNGTGGYDPTREGVYLDLAGDWGNAAAQYLMADDGGTVSSSGFKDGTGYSALLNLNLPMLDKTQGFVRYDSMDKKDTGTDRTLTILGVETEAKKNLMVAVDYQSLDDGTNTVNTVGVHAQIKI